MMSSTLLLSFLLVAAHPRLETLRFVGDPSEDFCVECCSLYCAAYPTSAVSNHLGPQDHVRYDAARLGDGHSQTAWVARGGIGEWVELAFLSGADRSFGGQKAVTKVYILNGYLKSESHWREHARVRSMDLLVDGVPRHRLLLLDTREPQRVDLPPIPLHERLALRFVVRDVYAGSRFNEVAVSEIRVDGIGHH